MRQLTFVLALFFVLALPSVAPADEESAPAVPVLPASSMLDPAVRQLCLDAVADDDAKADAAAQALRAMGPKGLEAMFVVYAKELHPPVGLIASPGAARSYAPAKQLDTTRLHAAVDAIAAQHEAWASRLYWYTDFEAAKAAAKESGKPILTLRLLGNLDEAVSCANSRFFRKTLYPNATISASLRKHFVLHWRSVRPIPRITIDFGDGRKLEKTITGNSAHYVVDSRGEPLDALPGLYGAKAFQRWLERVRDLHAAVAKLTGHERLRALERYHTDAIHRIYAEIMTDLDALKLDCYLGGMSTNASVATRRQHFKYIYQRLNDERWQQIAARHGDDARLDGSARRHIERTTQPPTARRAALVAVSKSIAETPMLRMIRNLQRSIAEDTVRNEYKLHVEIHERFLTGFQSDVEALNEWVYAELFLTPSSDPWLGLHRDDVFDGLPVPK